MAIELNHTIVHAYNKTESANFVAELLGLPPPEAFYHFLIVRTANGVSLDFLETDEKIQPQHYAFLISESEFDEIYGKIKSRNIPHWADPMKNQAGKINTLFGGRGVYFEDPSGNYLEIITRPYGSK
jgi:hypothetical protein